LLKASLFFHPNFRTKASLTIAELIVSDDSFGEKNLPASNFIFIASKNPKSKEPCCASTDSLCQSTLEVTPLNPVKASPKVTLLTPFIFQFRF
jgi:hypothetical protein